MALLAAAGAVAVAGCGSSSGNSPSSGTTSGSSGTNWATTAAAPSDFSKLVAAAKAEGSLTVFAPLVKLEAPAFKAFTAKYGVTVNGEDQPSSVAGASVETQEKTGKVTADLIQSSNFAQIQQFAKDGYLEKYTPQSASAFPASSEITDYAYPLGDSVEAIAWNTKTTPKAVQAELETNPSQALLSPSLKGKLLLIDANVGGSGMAIYANQIYNVKGYGWAYMQKLAAQSPSITSSDSTIANEVAGGTYDVTNSGVVGIFGNEAASGAPVRFVAPSPAPATQFEQGIVKGAPHPAAARLFAEWSTTLAGQEAISKALGFTSQHQGWVDNRPFMKKIPWYKPPKQIYLAWQTDPRLAGSGLKSFLAKWSSVFHHSN